MYFPQILAPSSIFLPPHPCVHQKPPLLYTPNNRGLNTSHPLVQIGNTLPIGSENSQTLIPGIFQNETPFVPLSPVVKNTWGILAENTFKPITWWNQIPTNPQLNMCRTNNVLNYLNDPLVKTQIIWTPNCQQFFWPNITLSQTYEYSK